MHGKQITCASHEQEDLTICKPHQHDMRAHKISKWCGNAKDAALLHWNGHPLHWDARFRPNTPGKQSAEAKKKLRLWQESPPPPPQLRCTVPLINGHLPAHRDTQQLAAADQSHQQRTRRTVGYFSTSSHFCVFRQQGRPLGSTVMTRR